MKKEVVIIDNKVYNLSDLEELSNWVNTICIDDAECITKVSKVFDVPANIVKIKFLPTCNEYCIWVGDEWKGYYNPLTRATTIDELENYDDYIEFYKLVSIGDDISCRIRLNGTFEEKVKQLRENML